MIVGLGTSIKEGQICVRLTRRMLCKPSWNFIIEVQRKNDGESIYYEPTKYRDADMIYRIKETLTPQDWIDIARITDKVEEALNV